MALFRRSDRRLVQRRFLALLGTAILLLFIPTVLLYHRIGVAEDVSSRSELRVSNDVLKEAAQSTLQAARSAEQGKAVVQPVANDGAGVAEVGAAADVHAIPQTPQGLSLDDLPSRPDAHCESGLSLTVPRAEQLRQLFACRAAVARSLAERACEDLGGKAPEREFGKANLQLRQYVAHGLSSPMELTIDTIPIAVEVMADIVSQDLRHLGVWEVTEVRAILKGLQLVRERAENATSSSTAAAAATAHSPPVLVDIGANLGVFSFVAAALGYNVIAFEAMPRNVEAIHQTLCWNPELRERLTLFPYGLAEAEHVCAIMSDHINTADGHLVCSEAQRKAYEGEMLVRGTVHAVRAGDYLQGVRTDVVKMDVEGYELQVLRGAGEGFSDVQYALTELSQDMAKKASKPFEEVVLEYLRGWDERDMDIRFCDRNTDCFAAPVYAVEEATAEVVRRGASNVLLTRRDPDA